MASDAIKWTDLVTAWSTLAQLVLLIVAAAIAWVQYRASVADGQTRLTIETFKGIDDIADAIDRTSAHLDFSKDWAAMQADLAKPDGDADRTQRERDLFTITNLFSKIARLYRQQLISPEMFLDEFDEYVLFVCAAVSGVYHLYTQPDYRGLFEVARRCQSNYNLRQGRYPALRTFTVPDDRAAVPLVRTKGTP